MSPTTATTPEVEAEARRLAKVVRLLWHRMYGPYRPQISADYREARRRLLAALLRLPGPVRLDAKTWAVPDEEGADVAFVPDPEEVVSRAMANFARKSLARLSDLQFRRHANLPEPERRHR